MSERKYIRLSSREFREVPPGSSEPRQRKRIELPPDIENSTSDFVDIAITIPKDQLLGVRDLAEQNGIPLHEGIQRTMDLGQVAWEAVQRGARVFLEDPDGKLSQVHLLQKREKGE